MDFFRNLAINLRATGPAAVVAIWFVCITALGILGGEKATMSLALLGGSGAVVLTSLLSRSPD